MIFSSKLLLNEVSWRGLVDQACLGKITFRFTRYMALQGWKNWRKDKKKRFLVKYCLDPLIQGENWFWSLKISGKNSDNPTQCIQAHYYSSPPPHERKLWKMFLFSFFPPFFVFSFAEIHEISFRLQDAKFDQ